MFDVLFVYFYLKCVYFFIPNKSKKVILGLIQIHSYEFSCELFETIV